MIQLHSHCLVFETAAGEFVPCSAEAVTVEVIGEAVDRLDREIIQQAAAAVLHYFKVDREQCVVTVAEFTAALERVLRGLGLAVAATEQGAQTSGIRETDLGRLAGELSANGELFLFPRLREELHYHLATGPQVVRFHNLRGCVKRILGARRWGARCRVTSDQIVAYLRECWDEEKRGGCTLVVR